MKTTQQIILELRRAGLTQSLIAKNLGIPQPRISRWESGDVPAATDDALRLLELLESVQNSPKEAA